MDDYDNCHKHRELMLLQLAENERLQARIETLRYEVDAIAAIKAERDEYQQAADRMAMEHKVERDALKADRDCAIAMLAEWCVAVEEGGSSWDYWDDHFKLAMYRPNSIRELLDAAIDAAMAATKGGV